MPDAITTDDHETRTRHDIALFADADFADTVTRQQNWRTPTRLVLTVLILGAGDVTITTPLSSDYRPLLEASTGGAAAQTAVSEFRETRTLSLRQARELAFKASTSAEQARAAARRAELLFWRSLDA